MIRQTLLSFALLSSPLLASDLSEKVDGMLSKGIKVDLRNPTLENGIFSTVQGGVINNDLIRIQAEKIRYEKRLLEGEEAAIVTAEGKLMIQYGKQTFVGRRLEYNFSTNEGVVFDGRTAIEPWYFGGKKIELQADGGFTVKQAFISTCENVDSEWQFQARKVMVKDGKFLKAFNLEMRFLRLPIFFTSFIQTNIEDFSNSPIKYRLFWGGGDGVRVQGKYRFYSKEALEAFALSDYSIKRGFGGGLQTTLNKEKHAESFNSRSYVAYDKSKPVNENRKRYRFDGKYQRKIYRDHVLLEFQYDRLSDGDMASDYRSDSFELERGGRTELSLWTQKASWSTSLLNRLRINSFQTVTQKLPSFHFSFMPYKLWGGKLIADSRLTASYLDLEHAQSLSQFQDINSTRVKATQSFYRNFSLKHLLIIPKIELLALHYGNTANGKTAFIGRAHSQLHFQSHLVKDYGSQKHHLFPYLELNHFSKPQKTVNEHYIFDSSDGITSLQYLKFGCKNILNSSAKSSRFTFTRCELYSYAFFSKKEIPTEIPKIYASIDFLPFPTLKSRLEAVWNLDQGEFDRSILLNEWTYSENFAAALELRHRGSYDWRKIDREDFALESIHNTAELHSSALSDKGDIVLFRTHYRFLPNWTLQLQSRHGFQKSKHPSFNELQSSIETLVRCAWKIKFKFHHKEDESKFSVHLSLAGKKPQKEDVKIYKW